MWFNRELGKKNKKKETNIRDELPSLHSVRLEMS